MSIAATAIRRPVFTTMLILAPVVLGAVSYARMGVDLFPAFEYPLVSVTTLLPGASAEEVERTVTRPLEEALGTVSGLNGMHSQSREGLSAVLVDFRLEKNRDLAAQEVRDKVGQALFTLPPGTTPPVVDKLDLNATPVLTLVVKSPRGERELGQLADKQIRPALEGLPGVGRVILAGARRRAISVEVDARRLEAHGLAVDQVRDALVAQNVDLPGGRVDSPGRETVLRTLGRVREPGDWDSVVVANVHGHPVRLRDVGRAVDTVEEPRNLARLDGVAAVELSVQKLAGANTLEVAGAVKTRLHELEASLPGDVSLVVVRDPSVFIDSSIREVRLHLVLGAVLVGLTILLFLNDWRTMLIAFVSIPASIISTFACLAALGFTINNVTLLALVLAVGIVIDDAVVVHENIYRWMEEKGLSAREAARAATEEITLAVAATTFSLVVIFLPIAFMEGVIGRFFQSFGITLAASILLSLGVGLTLTPMLCSRFLRLTGKRGERPAGQGGPEAHPTSRSRALYERPYLACLRWSMRHRGAVLLISLLVLASTPILYVFVEKDFMPKDDQSELQVTITCPEGWSLERVSEELTLVEARLAKLPAVSHVLTTVGDVSGRSGKGEGDVTRATLLVSLAPLEERVPGLATRALELVRPATTGVPRVTQDAVMRLARRELADFPDLRASVEVPPITELAGAGTDVTFDVLGPDIEQLARLSERILVALRRVPGVRDVDSTLALRKPELRVRVQRERAADLGVPLRAVAATLQTLVGGEVVTTWQDEATGQPYDVWLRASTRDRADPRAVERLSVASPAGGLVRVSSLATLEPARGPAQIDRIDRQRSVTVSANVEGIAIGTALDAVQRIVADVGLPPGYRVDVTGNAKILEETTRSFALAFALSLAFMYMILAAQFESFTHPIAILAALPLTIPFALLSLVVLGQALDVYSFFGLFLLFGIVKKNGILVVDAANQLRARGVPRDEAVLEANRTRLRPILMTTLMLIAGMIPIALGRGPGAASRASIALVILGGQSLSLVLSLLVTPVVFTYLDDAGQWLARRRHA